MLIVGSDAQCLVDDLLRKLCTGEQGGLLAAVRLHRRVKAVEIKKGHLLGVLRFQPFDVRVDEVFLFVDELRRPPGNEAP